MAGKGRQEFGQQLRAMRIRGGLTQWDVAWECGYTSAQFPSNWERGVSYPPFDAMRALARLFNVAPAALISDFYEAKHADLDCEKREKIKAVRRSA